VADNITIHYIPPLPPKREKPVGIYCRVSTNSADQLKSFTAQILHQVRADLPVKSSLVCLRIVNHMI